jgi:hypothetical protein
MVAINMMIMLMTMMMQVMLYLAGVTCWLAALAVQAAPQNNRHQFSLSVPKFRE